MFDKFISLTNQCISKDPIPFFPNDGSYACELSRLTGLGDIGVNGREGSSPGSMWFTVYSSTAGKHANGDWRTPISWFSLSELPGCCGILVSHNAHVCQEYRGRGVGTLLNELRIHMAHKFRYSILLCTTDIYNKAENKVLDRNKWKSIQKFKNERTGNSISVNSVDLTYDLRFRFHLGIFGLADFDPHQSKGSGH